MRDTLTVCYEIIRKDNSVNIKYYNIVNYSFIEIILRIKMMKLKMALTCFIMNIARYYTICNYFKTIA